MLFLLSLLAIGLPASAAPSASTTQACQAIAKALPQELSWPGSTAYSDETSEYWSTALQSIQPACVVHPTTTEDVATVITILNGYPDVDFAAKSGGHDPNPGHASVQDGVLIALRYITGATYDASTGLASVKPGGTWNDVIGDLETYNVTVVGGRLGALRYNLCSRNAC
jgi:FAD/FMN-containing dehydrogenase